MVSLLAKGSKGDGELQGGGTRVRGGSVRVLPSALTGLTAILCTTLLYTTAITAVAALASSLCTGWRRVSAQAGSCCWQNLHRAEEGHVHA